MSERGREDSKGSERGGSGRFFNRLGGSERSQGRFFWGVLGRFWVISECLGLILDSFGRSEGSWGVLGGSWGRLGAM